MGRGRALIGSGFLLQLQIELEQSKDECCDLMDRLEVAHIERTEAIVEKDDIVLKYHTEKERRRRAEREVSSRAGLERGR